MVRSETVHRCITVDRIHVPIVTETTTGASFFALLFFFFLLFFFLSRPIRSVKHILRRVCGDAAIRVAQQPAAHKPQGSMLIS